MLAWLRGRRCTRCRKRIRLFERGGMLKRNESYVAIERTGSILQGIELRRVGAFLDGVRPGRLCAECWQAWRAAQQEAIAARAEMTRRQAESSRQRELESRTVGNPRWVLTHMPIVPRRASDTTLQGKREMSLAEVLQLGNNCEAFFVSRYKPGADTARLRGLSGTLAFDWVVVRTGDSSYLLVDSQYEYTDA